MFIYKRAQKYKINIYKKAQKYKTNTLIPLWALMWKYVKARYYRYCHTFWESFGGVSVFITLLLIHRINLIKLRELEPETTTLMENRDSLTRVFFSPFNSFTRSLMLRAEAYLNQDSGVLPKKQWEFESTGYPMKFHANFFKTSHGIAEVKFKSNGSLTTDLEYSIHVITGEAKNYLNKAYNGVLRTITPKGEIAPSFLGQLQWAIDKSFIEQLSHQNIHQKLNMSTVPNLVMEELLTLHKFMIICTILGPLSFYLFFSTRLLVERRTGMKELMKRSGITSDVLRLSHMFEALFVGSLYSIAVTLVLMVTPWAPILPHSNFFIIAFTITFHFVNTMCFAFISTALSQDFLHSEYLGLVLYLSTYFFDFLWFSYKEYTFVLCCILPHAPVYYFWDEVLFLEKVGVGTQMWNINKCHTGTFSLIRVWILFLIQLDVTITLAWYLDLVRPGCYGIPKKWNFFVKKAFWLPDNKPKIIVLPSYLMRRDDRNFEKLPRKAEIALQVLNVSKVYKTFGSKTQVIALDSVTFDCYKGEVTMLLGANGAGKTTLMHIIAGMFKATEGIVYQDGFAIANKIKEVPHYVGVCMQRSICFRYLTVKENITFFKKLKGKTKEGFSVEHLLKKLKLSRIADYYGETLTEENMRCLQVACVLAGDADVMVLDEPTTGMDVDVRHRLWDLLMILRGHKTIIMTTSCLEEANALGDRIAILDKGVLKCHGSPSFLKNVIGTSFTLSISIKDSARLYDVKELVDGMIPKLECRIYDMRRITFSLPTKQFHKFPNLLEALEEKTTVFGIILIDVGMFMEEVFTKFIDTEMEQSDQKRIRENFSRERFVGFELMYKQIILLIERVYYHLMMYKKQFFALRVAIPVLCLLIITLTTNYSFRHKKLFSHQISQYHVESTRLLYNVAPYRRSGLFNAVNKYPGVETVYASDIDGEFSNPLAEYSNKETVGFKITDSYTTIFHPTDPGITSRSVNMFSNIYMSMFMPHLNNTIRTTYETLAKPRPAGLKNVKSSFLCLQWTSWVTFLVFIPITPTIILCIVERHSGIRDNHMMAGCTPLVYWGGKLLAHIIMFVFIILIPTIVVALALDFDNTFTQVWFCVCMASLLLMFGLAFLTSLYLLSFFLNESVAISRVYIQSLFFGFILPILISVLEVVWYSSAYIAVPYVILMVVARFSPVFALGMGLARITLTARLNAHCKLNRRLCPNLEFDDKAFDAKVCCQSRSLEPFPYFVSYETGLFDLINLFIQFIVFAMLILLLEYRIPQYIYEQFWFSTYKEPEQEFKSVTVIQERAHVRRVLRDKTYKEDVLLVDNVHKDYKYAKKYHKKKKSSAVQGITYAAQLGECLAILGPKSAGKTALMNMLAGTDVMTRGNSCVDGVFIRNNRMKYIHKISLSSSTGGMDDFWTGGQNLRFLAKLSGYSDEFASLLAYKALLCMGLLTNRSIVSTYSSGCLSRLSLCSALVLGPSVAFLDEPMKELDPSSKLLVANALQSLRLTPAALIVAETSMDWRLLQPVFDRIAIMVKGQFAAIGPAEDILASVAKGYSARIKLKMVTGYRLGRYYADDESSESESETDDLKVQISHTEKSVMFAQSLTNFKSDFLKTFNTSRLCREHLCMLYFYIEDNYQNQHYSVMFRNLQELKEKYEDLIEDYYLSSTTIEDVFWRLEYEDVSEDTTSVATNRS